MDKFGEPGVDTQRQALDPRRICNMMLDEAGTRPITNLALQKLLYFAHGIYLVETTFPLVTGYFEAWQYGPVHPLAYMAFRAAGDRPIDFRALRRDPLTGQISALDGPVDEDAIGCVRRVMMTYSRMTPGRLVELSHATGAPWHFVVDKARTSTAFGMRIRDSVILSLFKKHKVLVGLVPEKGEPLEDKQFA